LIVDFISANFLNVIVAIAIFFIGKIIAKYFIKILVKIMLRAKVDITLVKFIENMLFAISLVAIALTSLTHIGVETTSFVTVFGTVGIAIALAFKDSLSNVGAGIMIILFRPFKVGDTVLCAGEYGVIEEILIFHTMLKTPDNKVIIIPNSKITNGSITNYTLKEFRRCDFVFQVSYDSDIKKVKEILNNLLLSDSRVLDEPKALVAVGELASSSVDFVVRAWVKNSDFSSFRFDMLERVKLEFDKYSITIPYQQIDINLNKQFF
jgi:small conductance mechanosensitive channel